MFYGSSTAIDPEKYGLGVPTEYSPYVAISVFVVGALIIWIFRRYKESNT